MLFEEQADFNKPQMRSEGLWKGHKNMYKQDVELVAKALQCIYHQESFSESHSHIQSEDLSSVGKTTNRSLQKVHYGKKMEQLVKRFQKDLGYKKDQRSGIVDSCLWELLMRKAKDVSEQQNQASKSMTNFKK